MNSFFETLKGVEKVMYKSAYNFHTKYHEGATPESAHQAGLNELKRLGKYEEYERNIIKKGIVNCKVEILQLGQKKDT